MTTEEAEGILRRVSRQEIQLAFTQHFKDRAEERHPGLTAVHVYQVLRIGKIWGTPEWVEQYKNYAVEVRAKLPDLGQVKILFGISDRPSVCCVTVY